MSALPFTKMQAQGNDFVILNGLTSALPEVNEQLVRELTERRYGIGCDQLLVLLPDDKADAVMRIFNNDGSEAVNCGNGLRCVGDLLIRELEKDKVTISLKDRIVHADRSAKGIRVEMGAAKVSTQNIEVVRVDTERNILLVKGAVPGSRGGDVIVTPAIKLKNKG